MWYWQAPAAFLGDQYASYSESFAFDLRMRGRGPLFESSDVVLTAVPEPRAYALIAGGLGLAAWAGRRRRVNRG